MQTVLAIGDLHCGHKVGLTPPAWQQRVEWQPEQEKLWEFFEKTLDSIGNIDVLIVNGDAIDGNGYRSGGIEQTEVDWDRQCEMAEDVINRIGAKKIVMTYGTPSHVSNNGSQEEYKIAKAVGAEIDGHVWVEVDGVVFDVKHKVGSSGIPHGRASAISKEIMWNKLQAAENIQPKANVLLRSHVHYHVAVSEPGTLCMTLPALQGPRSKYGVEQCNGIVDFGLVWFRVASGHYTWDSNITRTILTNTVLSV